MANVRLNPSSLKRVGVSLSGYISTGQYQLVCDICGSTWRPNLLLGAHLLRDWWKCPENPSHTEERVQ